MGGQRNTIFPRSFNAYKPPGHFVYGVVCETPEKKYLLVKGRSSEKWSFPKGHRERGELAIDCALRELYEETGLVIERPNEYPASYSFSKGRDGSSPSYFHFKVDYEMTTRPRDTREIVETGWFTLEEMAQLNGNMDVSMFRKTYANGLPS
jgi:8-oxo-dGTP pyrophosphatase MutT (NUDIX family)